MASFGKNLQFAKHLARNEVLVPHLNNWFAIAEWPDEWDFTVRPNKQPDDAFHPSSALACEKELYYRLQGWLQPELARMDMNKTFLFGHFAHTVIQWIVVEGLKFATWDDIEKEHDHVLTTHKGNPMRIRGFPDIARCVIPNKGTYLVDIKTMNARVYAQQNLPGNLLEKYEAQVKLYLEFEDLDEALIVAVEKDSPHRFKEFRVQRDGALVDQIIAGWERVADARVEGIIPECTCWDSAKCPAKDELAIDYAKASPAKAEEEAI